MKTVTPAMQYLIDTYGRETWCWSIGSTTDDCGQRIEVAVDDATYPVEDPIMRKHDDEFIVVTRLKAKRILPKDPNEKTATVADSA
jgi:hypothetical protein